ncbi:DUF3331 domain-containing protein [Paraburkholderia phytofirmans]
MREEQLTNVWQQILDGFFSLESQAKMRCHPDQKEHVRAKRGRPRGNGSQDVAVRVWGAEGISDVERRSRATIAIDWADSTFGHYGEQLWSLGIARRKAVCALSGEQINRGDSIYRPRHVGGRVPLNSAAMILASFLDARYFAVGKAREYRSVVL